MFKGSPLFARAWELIGLGLLPVVYLLDDTISGTANPETLILGPMWMTLVLGIGALRMAFLDGAAVWTALFWFRVSVAIYFGAGSLVPLLASAGTRAYLEASYLFFNEEIAKVNLIVALSCPIVLGFANLYFALAGTKNSRLRASSTQGKKDGSHLLAAGAIFLVAGGIVKYLFTVPQMFGLTDFILPGSVGLIGNFTYAAVFFLTAWSYENNKKALPLVVLLVLWELLIGVLALTKTEVLTVLMMFLLAFTRRRATFPRLAVVMATMLVCYVTLQPIIDFERLELQRRDPNLQGADLTERLEILDMALNSSGAIDDGSDVQAPLVRIAYMSSAIFAVRQYDAGHPGDSFSLFLAVFVPRFLWSDKPTITQAGNDFNFAATGIWTSASSPGLFAEAYWNFGWLGVVLLMVPLGMVLASLSRYSLAILHREQWLYFPVVVLGMRIGFRTDGFYVADVVGGVILLASMHVAFRLLDGFVFTMFRRPMVTKI